VETVHPVTIALRRNMRKAIKYPLLGIGSLVGIIVVLFVALVLSPRATKRKLFFFVNGTTDPFSLLAEKTPHGERIVYGNDPLQFGELNLPTSGNNFPVAIVIHGGCWVNQLPGLPAEATSLDLLRPLAHELANHGIATWNIEYRRIGNSGGGWPGTFEDISAAADKLNAIASANHLDLSHVIVIGHSAGGQLALWLAARPKLPSTSPLYTAKPLRIAGVVDIDGPPSLRAASLLDDQVCGTHVVAQFLGGTPTQVPDRYRLGSVDGLLPIGIRQKLLYSGKTEFLSSDRTQWSNLFILYATEATNAGDPVQVIRMDKAGHFDGINPASKTWPTVADAINSVR
jgi:acetyl esterase/lipase